MTKSNLHPLQSRQWGEFRQKMGITVIEESPFLLTIHKIPNIPWNVGYLPKGPLPTKEQIYKLKEIGKENNCIFILLEPKVLMEKGKGKMEDLGLRPSAHPLFTKYTFILDLTESEDELLKNMHPKTRYNIKVAQKHGVEIIEDNSDAAFEEYVKLTKETTQRQKFYAHTEKYHRHMWETLKVESGKLKVENFDKNRLTAHLFLAPYRPSSSKLSTLNSQLSTQILAAWIIFVLGDTMYYPYGASSSQHRETMASNLMMWEVIKWGKNKGLKTFDMWGALSENPDPKDPWFGFHRFKQGYGPELVEFVGSYDLVINPILYELYKIANKLRWFLLKLKRN